MFCREHAAQLGRHLPQIEAADASLVVVGNGNVFMANAFREDFNVAFPIYVDPKLEVYRAAGLRRSIKTTFNAASLKAGVRALRAGHMQGMVKGDAYQQGGTFVVHPGGKVKFRHISGFAGDIADPGQVMAALTGKAP